MKKTLLSVLAGITVIGSAAALPTPKQRELLCKKRPDKYLWVPAGDGACVEYNPCMSDSSTDREVYCNKTFSNIRIRNASAADALVDAYTKGKFAMNVLLFVQHPKTRLDSKKYHVTTDTQRALTTWQDYRVFEFEQIGYDGARLAYDAFAGACTANGGNISTKDKNACIVDHEYGYRGKNCKDVSDLAELVYGGKLDIVVSDSVDPYYDSQGGYVFDGPGLPTFQSGHAVDACVFKN